MAAPLRYRLRAQSCRYGAADWGRGQRGRSTARAFGGAKQRILVKATALEAMRAAPCARPLDKAICGCNTVITPETNGGNHEHRSPSARLARARTWAHERR